MNCQQARHEIDQLNAAAPPQAALLEHLRDCDLCRHYYGEAQLAIELSALEVPGPSAAFVEQAIRQAVQRGASRRWSERWRVPSAIAASLLVAVVVGLLNLPGADNPLPVAQLDGELLETSAVETAPVYRQEQVRILIRSEADHDDAEILIELAENLELEGYAGQRQLAWNTPLRKGANLLTLPVLVREDGGEIKVSSRFGERELVVNVKVGVGGKQSNYEEKGADRALFPVG